MNLDRFLLAALALLGVCAVSAAVADPPTAPAPTTTTPVTTTTAAPATPAPNAAAAAVAKPPTSATPDAAQAAAEKRLLAAGYRPEMQHGQKVWCRREPVLGSRIEGRTVCGTPDQLNMVERQTEQDISDAQKKLNTYPTH